MKINEIGVTTKKSALKKTCQS